MRPGAVKAVRIVHAGIADLPDEKAEREQWPDRQKIECMQIPFGFIPSRSQNCSIFPSR
jgi:hypothetical protein